MKAVRSSQDSNKLRDLSGSKSTGNRSALTGNFGGRSNLTTCCRGESRQGLQPLVSVGTSESRERIATGDLEKGIVVQQNRTYAVTTESASDAGRSEETQTLPESPTLKRHSRSVL